MNNSNSYKLSCSTDDLKNPPEVSNISKLTPTHPQGESPPSPNKTDGSDDSDTWCVSKFSQTPKPGPISQQPTHAKVIPPQSSGYREQGPIFKFDPTSIKMNTPNSSNLSKSVDLPSHSSEIVGVASDQQEADANVLPADLSGRRATDPNFKTNYRQNMHITNRQRENYGRNILARYPSFDGSKSKYIPNGSLKRGERRGPPPVLPKPSKIVVKLDAEVGSSQC